MPLRRRASCLFLTLMVAGAPLAPAQTERAAEEIEFRAHVTSAAGRPVEFAQVVVNGRSAQTDVTGRATLRVSTGRASIEVLASHYATIRLSVDVESNRDLDIQLQPAESVTVRAEADVLSPDPSANAYSRDEVLEANPGRPGLPLSIPGFPAETSSGGIKAPQYFAPGVAGDHGEPIAQFLQVGGFLFQNNLTANAHGNGYSDPNIMIPAALAGVLVDNAAFNARYGDHSINLAATYELRKRVAPFVAVTTDGRDADLSAGWSPANPDKRAFVAFEASAGNGFLARPEERQQYKMNAARTWERGNHEVTAFGIGYYGFSRIPGLIPFDAPVASDTIDPRQADLTHTTLALVTDRWRSSAGRTLQSSAYFRTYSIDLRSDFGAGLIRQSEFRTVAGGNAMYTQVLSRRWTGLAGVDVRRDAPRELDLALADAGGVFRPVTSNDLTIIDSAAFVAVNGNLNRSVHVYGGVRRDQISFVNGNRLSPEASFRAWPGTTSPKASITFGREDAPVLPEISFSFGKAFHANDPRIGNGAAEGSAGGAMQAMRGDLIIHAREYQLVATKLIEGTEVRVTLAHITNSAELAKIDPDTGLQQNLGPSVNRYVTVAVRHRYDGGFVQVSYSQADAVDRELHQPLPEAPRLIVDAVGTMDRLPWGMHAKSEFTYVGEKPLGDGFRSVPVREIRLNLARSFGDGRWIASVNGELARGHTGQTLETLALPGEGAAFERVVGVPLRSYASGSLQYQFGH